MVKGKKKKKKEKKKKKKVGLERWLNKQRSKYKKYMACFYFFSLSALGPIHTQTHFVAHLETLGPVVHILGL